MLSFNITHRFTGSILFTAEIEATEETPISIKLGLAVRKAISAGANLARANLADANLAGANLARANLADANLAGANLARANLARANLAGANLAGANLADANLAGANLAGANLAGGFKWRNGVLVTKVPIQISGLKWRVTILDDHMEIGCQFHSLADWGSFDDRQIADMDGRDALKFWRTNKDMLLGLARASGRGETPEKAA